MNSEPLNFDNNQSNKVPVCSQHLSEFYDALKAGNISLLAELEQELTPEEKCVACAYILKTQGTVREALEMFLNEQGLSVAHSEKSVGSLFIFWGVRGALFIGIFVADLYVAAIVRQFIFQTGYYSLFSFSVIGYSFVALISLVFFLYIDDKFLD